MSIVMSVNFSEGQRFPGSQPMNTPGTQQLYLGDDILYFSCFFEGLFCVFQSGAIFLAICLILELKSLICMLFAAYLLHFEAKNFLFPCLDGFHRFFDGLQ